MSDRSKWSLIGIPDHLGVVNVGGRVGAARGPFAFRKALLRLKGRDPVQATMQDCGDLKDITVDIQLNLRNAAEFVRNAHRANGLSVVVGGGHDHGYSQLLGIAHALDMKFPLPRLGCINIDAHLDVRKPSPVITSGSPFYLSIETGLLDPKNFVEFGIQSHCNGPELWDFVERKKVKVVPFENLRHGKGAAQFKSILKKLSSSCDAVVVSVDMDAVESAYAPGVSAPQSEGFSATDLLEIMECAGEESKVVSVGIFELNPEHDLDNRTSQLAATAAYHFISRALRR